MFPCFTGICRFIHAITKRDISSHFHFTHPNIYYIRICLSNFDSSNTCRPKSAITYTMPVNTTICSFPKASANSTGIIHLVIVVHSGNCNTSTRPERTNISPMQTVKQRFGNGRNSRCGSCSFF